MFTDHQIRVWDLFVRVFHWSLVLFFFVAYATGDDKGSLHRYVGYAVLGLVAVRILWGFIGTEHARFSDFMCSPVKALAYVKGLATGKPTYFIGHNPAAAWVILFFLISSLVVCLSGYAAYVSKEAKPVLGLSTEFSFIGKAYADEDEKEEREDEEHNKEHGAERDGKGEKEDAESDSIWGDIHEISAQFMLILIFMHIVGVAVSSFIHNENLVRSMITGEKARHVS